MALCWPLQMPPTPKAVLISLADNANDHGYCWPSLTKICERTCFGRTAVIEAVKWLEAHGAVRGDRSDRYRTTYVVTPANYAAGELVREANQSGRRTSSDDGVLVRLADDEVRQPDDEVREADTNRQEPSVTVKRSNRKAAPMTAASLDLSSWPEAPNPDLVNGWLKVRKAKRADVSEIVISAMAKQLRLAAAMGWSVDECLTECVLRNWQALKAEWLEPKRAGHGDQPPPNAPQSRTNRAAQNMQETADALIQRATALAHQGNQHGPDEAPHAELGWAAGA
ncbi:Helix-turn-helix domain-containing protein [Luteibacter sp. UNC138MFCol5.1]|nr:Helix-turn-helix domain-containing protein [Luteibacter sp. UNC138MFCol5.1]